MMDTPPAIIDGDTFRLGAERVRIENIDAPEIHGRCDAETKLAALAKEKLSIILMSATPEVQRHGTDRYGRTLALIRVEGADVGDMLIAANVAVPWKGRRHDWCSVLRK